MSTTKNDASKTFADAYTQSLAVGISSAFAVPHNIAQRIFEMTAESLDFIGKRMNVQAEFLGKAANCIDPAQAATLNRSYWEDFSRDYANEAERVAERLLMSVTRPLEAANDSGVKHRAA